MKKLLILTACLLFFVHIPSAVCQVTMIKQDKEFKIDSYSTIKLWYDYNGTSYSLYLSIPERSTIGIALGRTKSEAIKRLTEIKDACDTGNPFNYNDGFLTKCFYPAESGKYRVSTFGHSEYAYFYPSCLTKAISWIQNVKE